MKHATLPILYSFRRCPYAIRARLALYYSGVNCELREVVLKTKPPSLFTISPKGTVPVLLLDELMEKQQVIDQSIDIVDWALNQSDPHNWLEQSCDHHLIAECDGEFKHWLDRYKYADRFPEQDESYYFQKGCLFLQKLEKSLVSASNPKSSLYASEAGPLAFCIETPQISVLDTAIFPFVRQFAFVNKQAFDALELPKLQAWLDYFLNSVLFLSIMQKYPMWLINESDLVLFGRNVN